MSKVPGNDLDVMSLEREARVRDALLHEVHHRVKNNLQTLESLMRMHMRRCDSPEALNVLQEVSCRLLAMTVVHEMLSEASAEFVDVVELSSKVATQVKLGLKGEDEAFKVKVSGQARLISGSLATSLALVVAEIVHNSFEHGFSGRSGGLVSVSFLESDDYLVVCLVDDGNGLPAGFSLDCPRSMGLTLMKTLVEDDLHGKLEVKPQEQGAGFCFGIPWSLLCVADYAKERCL